jgi:hypothetical protein
MASQEAIAQFERRYGALLFAARLRGATEEITAVNWMQQSGYVTIEPTITGERVTLTDKGIERADAILDEP